MPNEKSLPGSAPKVGDRSSVGKAEDRFVPKFLRLNKYINRPAASLIVRAVYHSRITPNQITVLSFLIGLAGAFFFFQGRPRAYVVGAILTQLASIVDCADGQLARARHQMSAFGAYLDLLCDRVTEFFLITGCAYGFYRYSGRLDVFVLGLVGCGLYFLQMSLLYLLKPYYGETSLGDTAELRSWLMFATALFAVINKLDWGLYTLFVASLGINVAHFVRFLRSRRV